MFAFWFAAFFAVVTYIALSTRAILSPFEVKHFIEPKRILSIVIGASILWLAIRTVSAEKSENMGAQIIAVLRISVPGTIALLLAREAYDLAVSGELAQQLGRNVRWMMTWVGYFAAGVAAFFAHVYYRKSQSFTRSTLSAKSDMGHAVDAITHSERVEILDLLIMMRCELGYESADPGINIEAQEMHHRRQKIDRLLTKFADK